VREQGKRFSGISKFVRVLGSTHGSGGEGTQARAFCGASTARPLPDTTRRTACALGIPRMEL